MGVRGKEMPEAPIVAMCAMPGVDHVVMTTERPSPSPIGRERSTQPPRPAHFHVFGDGELDSLVGDCQDLPGWRRAPGQQIPDGRSRPRSHADSSRAFFAETI
jgi:hypothetical protein